MDNAFATGDAARSIYGDAARSFLNPSSLFVDSNYRLRFSAWCSVAGVTLALRYRFLRSTDNEIVDSAEQLVPTSNRVLTSVGVALAVGYLIDAQAFALAGAPPYGTCFVKVELIRGADAVATVVATLVQGYVTANQTKAWPGGTIDSSFDGAGALVAVVGANPGAGNNISETMPAGARRELISFRARLTASAVVANRFPRITLDDGSATPYYEAQDGAAALVASTSGNYIWAQGLTATVNQNTFPAPLPINARLGAGHRIKTVTVGIDVGDVFDQIEYLLREWLTAD